MRSSPRRSAFTLMELLIVMLIISILLGFILVAAVNATREAQAKATQALIAKLDTGLADRLEAIMSQNVNPSTLTPGASPFSNQQSACLEMSYIPIAGVAYGGAALSKSDFQRAGVIARYDQIKAEIPDVFVVQDTTGALQYPLNFAMTPYLVNGNLAAGPINTDLQAVYPTGCGTAGIGLGIWGTTYPYLTGVYKNLGKYTDPTNGQMGAGFIPKGYNGVDDNGNGFVDDIGESGGDSSITNALLNHKHITARAEALYALLVEGQGPYGSVFNRDDFTNAEVKDTDQDGLPEFVDGWGNPLQFYRWPIFYHSDVQRGLQFFPTGAIEGDPSSARNQVYGLADAGGNAATPYGTGPFTAMNLNGAFAPREQDPLDQNQQLIQPAWWSSSQNSTTTTGQFSPDAAPPVGTGISASVAFFQTYFHQLVEPLASGSALGPNGSTYQRYWDRSAALFPARRAYYTRYLILSAGPDGQPGTPYLTDPRYNSKLPAYKNGTAMFNENQLKGLAPNKAAFWLQIESQAAQATLERSPDWFQMPSLTNSSTPADGNYYTNQLQAHGQDDVSNHNLTTTGFTVQ